MRNKFNLNKLGHLAPIKQRDNKNYSFIELQDTTLAYCKSGNFLYNAHEQKRLLYNAQPCIYTDSRFNLNYLGNSYRNVDFLFCSGDHKTFLKRNKNAKKEYNPYFFKKKKIKSKHNARKPTKTLKACIRRVNKINGIPKNSIIKFEKWYFDTRFNIGFRFKIKKERPINIKYNLDLKDYFEPVNEFGQILRSAGFIVERTEDKNSFIAYGYNKIIGFTENNESMLDWYSDGCENILWDFFDEFNKWSQCNCIPKNTPTNEIIKILKETNNEIYS